MAFSNSVAEVAWTLARIGETAKLWASSVTPRFGATDSRLTAVGLQSVGPKVRPVGRSSPEKPITPARLHPEQVCDIVFLYRLGSDSVAVPTISTAKESTMRRFVSLTVFSGVVAMLPSTSSAQSTTTLAPAGCAAWALPGNTQQDLRSLNPQDVLTKLDLTIPALETVRAKAASGDRPGALGELLDYYRDKYPLPDAPQAGSGSFPTADDVVNHVLQWGPYDSADYGDDVNWEWDPRGDIEWVAAVYRFYWAGPLAEAYRATRDDKYVKAFVELAADWIAKHPLEKRGKTHPIYTSWRGFAWLDIQTGIRADVICNAFPALVHGESFTPEFLGILLASLYDHQVKTERIPMGKIHNKAVFEQRGFVNVASTFPEFGDAGRWMKLAMGRTRENFLAQTTPDGVQREWSFGYNLAVLRDAVDIMRRMHSMDVEVPADYQDRVRRMYDYIFAIATPELAGPMFGDASRSVSTSRERAGYALYSTLVEATELLDDPKYAARANLDRAKLPTQKSYAFRDAGIYVLRDDWGPEQIYFSLHCSPLGISGHDQADNGTFELCAYGRWLMPDTGYYTYGHDAKGRAWHRQTSVHQTLTLNGKNSRIDGKQLLWQTSPELDAIVVENASYEGLRHRRTAWFVDKKFIVLLDEAVGDAEGTLDLHFQLAPGEALMEADENWATTRFDDANVLVWANPDADVSMHEEEGWHAWKYGHRRPRPAFRYRHRRSTPAAFLTLVVPYIGKEPPQVSAALPDEFQAGADPVEFKIEAFGKLHKIGRDLEQGKAWCSTD